MNKPVSIVLVIMSLSCVTSKTIARTYLSENDSCNKLSLSFNADMVSRYIWRGLPLCLNPNIQPYVTLNYKNFSLGTWGSYGLSSTYAETDIFISYTFEPVTLTINDYFNEDESDLTACNYFKWGNENGVNTSHSLEGAITFNGNENFPVSLSASTFFYGNDKDTTNNKNYFSTYLECAYKLTLSDNEIKVFVGGTTHKGYYANKLAVVNLGVTFSREIKVSNSFSIPVFSSFILNPYAKDIFLTIGMTF
jgi:hypothetical protein